MSLDIGIDILPLIAVGLVGFFISFTLGFIYGLFKCCKCENEMSLESEIKNQRKRIIDLENGISYLRFKIKLLEDR